MRPLSLIVCLPVALLAALSVGAGLRQDAAPAARPPEHAPVASEIASLAWLAGSWAAVEADTRSEENWTVPAGGTMLATAREVRGKKTASFEFLRIEEREGKLVYVAMPMAKGSTAFTLTAQKERFAQFENPKHDFPKRITYRLEGDELVTRIDGGETDTTNVHEARYSRSR